MNEQAARHKILRLGCAHSATLCALAIGIFFLATIRDGHEWGDDFSLYIRHAQNIVRGESYGRTLYLYNAQNPAVGPREYPPGFPLLLAPVVAVFGLELRPMKILVLTFFVGSLLVMIPLFGRILPTTDVTLLILVVGLNPFFWEFKDHVLSDVPFLFFVLLSLLFFTRADLRDQPPRRRATFVVVSGLAAYAAFATRALGLLLIPCYIGTDLVRKRRITASAAVAVAVILAAAGLHQIGWPSDSSYFDQVSNPLAAARQNAPAYMRALADLWENGYSNDVRRIAFLASGVLAVIGYVSAWRTGASAMHVFPPLYLAAVLMWPSYQGTRLLIPVVPFYFCYCLVGVRQVALVAARGSVPRTAVKAVFLIAVLFSYGARYSVLQFGPLPNGIATQESTELFAFVTAATDPEDVLVFSKPRVLALMTERRVSGPYRPVDPCHLWHYIRKVGASYIITGPAHDRFNEDAVYLQQFVRQFPGELRRVMSNRDVAVYRIEGNPCP